MTRLLESKAALRDACDATRARGGLVGLVPTMGFLHEGHRSLMRAARSECDLVVATIFVNPLQFGAGEDLDRYPRDLEGDRVLCATEGVDVVFHPSVAEMYPGGPPATTVHVGTPTADLCGRARPTHFDGVTTVVAKLFAVAGPCRAYFGAKDWQQYVVVKRMSDDLDLPVDVVACPTIREIDGLARSSRNAYLDDDQRGAATALFRSLSSAAEAIRDGERVPHQVAHTIREVLAAEPSVEIEYVEVRAADSLAPLDRLDGRVLLAIAARLGSTRLIDNVRVTIRGADVTLDLGTGHAPGGREQPCTAR